MNDDHHDPDELDTAVLILLKDDLPACRLVVTWPQAAGAMERDRDEGLGRWSILAGVDIEDIQHLEPLLFGNGLLGPDGFVEEKALKYVRAVVLQDLGAKPTRRRKASS